MGQQQLLLVILVTIIVGIATVVAINVFGSSVEQANEDAIRQDLLSIGASAQGWFIKPALLSGGGNNYTNLDFSSLGFGCNQATPTTTCTNPNAVYTITTAAGDVFEVKGVSELTDFEISLVMDTNTIDRIGTATVDL